MTNPAKLKPSEIQSLVERLRQRAAESAAMAPPATQSPNARRIHQQRLMRAAGVMPVDQDASWDWEPTRGPGKYRNEYSKIWEPRIHNYCEMISEYVADGQGVFLGGGLGSGKTSCLALIALAAYQADIPAVYMRSGQDVAYACDIVDARHRTYVTSYNSAAEVTDSTKQWPHSDVKILLIDDLDYTDNDAALSVVGRYLYNAYANEQCVCVGCNLTWNNMVTIKALSRVADRWERHIPPHRRLMTAENSLRAKR